MANGKKNYFRHSFFAGSDDKIVDLISKHGKQAYFHFFRLLELCGQQSGESVPEKFVFHRRTLCGELLVTNSRLGHHLLAMQSSLLLHYVLTDSKVEILVPNLSKYLGKYTNKIPSNPPNKIKEKKIKGKKIKVNNIGPNTKELSDHFLNEVELKEFLLRIPDYTSKKILSSYEKDVLLNKIPKAYKWHLDNGATTKRVGLFITNWLENKKYDNAHQKKEEQESAYMKLINSNPYND